MPFRHSVSRGISDTIKKNQRKSQRQIRKSKTSQTK
nr:MAG TPA: hypothetical protein [Inoviridae sp.]DAU25708.1 MAG TPA: hypothetical protein [Inoviridae sp.]DAV53252.1 MAG TPA: hypothetical protein [Inoviridae sp.]